MSRTRIPRSREHSRLAYRLQCSQKCVCCFSRRVGPEKSPILGRSPTQPGPRGSWERPRPGPRSIDTDFQPGRPSLKQIGPNPLPKSSAWGCFPANCDSTGHGIDPAKVSAQLRRIFSIVDQIEGLVAVGHREVGLRPGFRGPGAPPGRTIYSSCAHSCEFISWLIRSRKLSATHGPEHKHFVQCSPQRQRATRRKLTSITRITVHE